MPVGGLGTPGGGHTPPAERRRTAVSPAAAMRKPLTCGFVANHAVAPPLIAYAVRRCHVVRIVRVTAAAHRHQLVQLVAHRVTRRQAVVDCLAAYVARQAHGPHPVAQPRAPAAVRASRVWPGAHAMSTSMGLASLAKHSMSSVPVRPTLGLRCPSMIGGSGMPRCRSVALAMAVPLAR